MPSKRIPNNDFVNHFQVDTPDNFVHNKIVNNLVSEDDIIAQSPIVTPIPPSPGSCTGSCTWTWSVATLSWTLTLPCAGGCTCVYPVVSGGFNGQTTTTYCVASPAPTPVPTPTPVPAPVPAPIPIKNLWMWGNNLSGQMGNYIPTYDNYPPNSSFPTQTLDDNYYYGKISAGFYHFGAITGDGISPGYLWMWGYNRDGQIGDGTFEDKRSPVMITTSSDWIDISCGRYHTAAIKSDNTLYTWGKNVYGILGQNDMIDRSSPTQVGTDTTWSQVSCGYINTAAIKDDGTLWVWGNNFQGQLGNDDYGYISLPLLMQQYVKSPIQVGSDTDWYQVSCGRNMMAALKNNSLTGAELWVWGLNDQGQLGTNDTDNRSSPVQTVMATQSWVYVSAKTDNTQAVDINGTIWAFGNNSYGQLGDSLSKISKSSPVQNIASGTFVKVVAGNNHAAGLTDDGLIWSWGRGDSGQLGNGLIMNYSSPVQTVATINSWKDIAAGANFTGALVNI